MKRSISVLAAAALAFACCPSSPPAPVAPVVIDTAPDAGELEGGPRDACERACDTLERLGCRHIAPPGDACPTFCRSHRALLDAECAARASSREGLAPCHVTCTP